MYEKEYYPQSYEHCFDVCGHLGNFMRYDEAVAFWIWVALLEKFVLLWQCLWCPCGCCLEIILIYRLTNLNLTEGIMIIDCYDIETEPIISLKDFTENKSISLTYAWLSFRKKYILIYFVHMSVKKLHILPFAMVTFPSIGWIIRVLILPFIWPQ